MNDLYLEQSWFWEKVGWWEESVNNMEGICTWSGWICFLSLPFAWCDLIVRINCESESERINYESDKCNNFIQANWTSVILQMEMVNFSSSNQCFMEQIGLYSSILSLFTNWYKIPLPRINRGTCCNVDPKDISHTSSKLFLEASYNFNFYSKLVAIYLSQIERNVKGFTHTLLKSKGIVG